MFQSVNDGRKDLKGVGICVLLFRQLAKMGGNMVEETLFVQICGRECSGNQCAGRELLMDRVEQVENL